MLNEFCAHIFYYAKNGERQYHRRMYDSAVFYDYACAVSVLFGRRTFEGIQQG